jgi:hypothetical protein
MKSGIVFVAIVTSTLAWAAEDRPKVTFYRYGRFSMSARKITVYCDDSEVVRLENRSYFTTYITLGHHSFRDKKDDNRGVQPLEIIAEPGAEYFVRVEWVNEGGFIKSGIRPHLTLTDPITISPFFRELKAVGGSLALTLLKSPTTPIEQRPWVSGILVDIEHVSHPVPGTQTPDEEWIYTFKGDRYTFVASERTYRITGFRHIGIAVGEGIKYATVNDSVVIQDASGRERPLQLIKKITNTNADR